MSKKIVKELDNGYTLVEFDTRESEFCGVPGYISYWIVDKNDNWIKSFPSSNRALAWWETNRYELDTPLDETLEREAKRLTRKMGLKWETLDRAEKQEWIDELC